MRKEKGKTGARWQRITFVIKTVNSASTNQKAASGPARTLCSAPFLTAIDENITLSYIWIMEEPAEIGFYNILKKQLSEEDASKLVALQKQLKDLVSKVDLAEVKSDLVAKIDKSETTLT